MVGDTFRSLLILVAVISYCSHIILDGDSMNINCRSLKSSLLYVQSEIPLMVQAS